MRHANVHIPVRGTVIVRPVRNTTAKTAHEQIAARMVPRKSLKKKRSRNSIDLFWNLEPSVQIGSLTVLHFFRLKPCKNAFFIRRLFRN